MKTFSGILLAVVLCGARCQSQPVALPYEVGVWQGFRSAAVTYTFDDNCPNQLAIAVPMFNEFGFKLTLFTVTNSTWGWPANWTGLQNAAALGHEIASHTASHASLTGMADSLQTKELQTSQAVIESRISGKKCATIAYPNCNVGNTTIIGKYYFAGRGCSGVVESRTPSNFMNISSIICGTQGSVKTSADFKSRVDNAATNRGWTIYLIHGINGTESGAYSPIAADTIRASLNYLKANPAKFWVATFGDAAKYVRERNAASVTERTVKSDTITIAVTDTLDNTYYDCPVTIRRPLPEGWTSALVLQKGKAIASQIVSSGSTTYVMFDVVPDQGDITLVNSNATGVEEQGMRSVPGSFELYQNFPNPFNPSTTISYYIPQGQHIELKVFDVLGHEISTLVKAYEGTGMHTVRFSGRGLASGIYYYSLRTEQTTQVKKLMLMQ